MQMLLQEKNGFKGLKILAENLSQELTDKAEK